MAAKRQSIKNTKTFDAFFVPNLLFFFMVTLIGKRRNILCIFVMSVTSNTFKNKILISKIKSVLKLNSALFQSFRCFIAIL